MFLPFLAQIAIPAVAAPRIMVDIEAGKQGCARPVCRSDPASAGTALDWRSLVVSECMLANAIGPRGALCIEGQRSITALVLI